MPLGGYNGLQYGSFGWETFDDFLKSPNRWYNNTYYSGKPNGGNFHWYSRGKSPKEFVTQFYNWEEWQSVGQDLDSQLIGKHSSFFNPNGAEIQRLIIETTGVSYKELKNLFINTEGDKSLDADGDGMPDSWEKQYNLNPTRNDADRDLDNDGILNLVEFENSTNPDNKDTDGDGMPDGWELKNNLDPLIADSFSDIDNDSLTNFEEFEIQSNPNIFDIELNEITYEWLSIWLKSSHIQNDLIDIAPIWRDHRGYTNELQVPFNHNAPKFTKLEIDAYPNLDFTGSSLKASDTNLIGNENGGWTIFLVLRVQNFKNDGLQYSLIGNDVWRDSGFRLTMNNGFLSFYSTHLEDSFSLNSFSLVNKEQITIITLQYDSINEKAALYLDGQEQGRAYGKIPQNKQALWIGHIGGMKPQNAQYFEIMVYDSLLNHEKRRVVESMMLGKYLNKGLGAKDQDKDSIADWWQLEFGHKQNSDGDDDLDGLSNFDEFMNRTDPYRKDSDKDGLKDDWEINNGWDPLLNDLFIDQDDDGLNSVYELEVGADPHEKDTDKDQMLDGWEYNNGLNPVVKDGNNDPDLDGLTNLLEFVFATDPFDPDTDNDTLTDSQEVLKGWDPLQNAIITDSDEDSLSDFEEFRLGTNINSPDSDNDLISDSHEVAFGLDPLTNDANDDLDNDGLINIREVNYKTNPFDDDTDNDEIPDGWEVENFLNPLLDDSKEDFDFDGIINFNEFINKTNLSSGLILIGMECMTFGEKSFGFDDKKNESQNDDDGDNVSNLVEFILGGDPLDEDSVPDLKVEYLNGMYYLFMIFPIIVTIFMRLSFRKWG